MTDRKRRTADCTLKIDKDATGKHRVRCPGGNYNYVDTLHAYGSDNRDVSWQFTNNTNAAVVVKLRFTSVNFYRAFLNLTDTDPDAKQPESDIIVEQTIPAGKSEQITGKVKPVWRGYDVRYKLNIGNEPPVDPGLRIDNGRNIQILLSILLLLGGLLLGWLLFG